MRPGLRPGHVKYQVRLYLGRPKLPSLHQSGSSDASWVEGWKRSVSIPSSRCIVGSRLKRCVGPTSELRRSNIQHQCYPYICTGERTSRNLLTYVQYKQSLLRLPIRRNLIREVWIHIHSKVPGDRLWWFDKRELPPVAGNRQNKEVGRLRGVNIEWNTGEDHGSERELGDRISKFLVLGDHDRRVLRSGQLKTEITHPFAICRGRISETLI